MPHLSTTSHRRALTRLVFLLLLLLLLFLCLAAPAAVLAGGGETPPAEAPAPAGLRAYLDSETGELTSQPSPEQVEALSKSLEQSLDRSTEGLETFALGLGGRGVYLQGRFQNALVARRGADGRLELICVDDPALVHRIEGSADPTAAEEPVGRPETRWEEK